MTNTLTNKDAECYHSVPSTLRLTIVLKCLSRMAARNIVPWTHPRRIQQLLNSNESSLLYFILIFQKYLKMIIFLKSAELKSLSSV